MYFAKGVATSATRTVVQRGKEGKREGFRKRDVRGSPRHGTVISADAGVLI